MSLDQIKERLNRIIERSIGTAEADVTVDVPIDATEHALARLIRPGNMEVDEKEIVQSIQKAADRMIELFLETGKTHFHIYDRSQQDLNIVLEISKPAKGPLEMRIITVIKKRNFIAKAGTKTVIV